MDQSAEEIRKLALLIVDRKKRRNILSLCFNCNYENARALFYKSLVEQDDGIRQAYLDQLFMFEGGV